MADTRKASFKMCTCLRGVRTAWRGKSFRFIVDDMAVIVRAKTTKS